MQSALTAVKGVSKANVKMPNKAMIIAEDGVKTDDLIKAITDAGFGATQKAKKAKKVAE